MSKTVLGPQRALQRVKIEPKRGKLCATCGKAPSAAGDPFCSATCCRAYFGTEISPDYARNVPRPDTIRPDTLRCHGCDKWLPDDAFCLHRRAVARRGRRNRCRECQAKRRAGRGRVAECEACGGPCSSDAMRCADCYAKIRK